MRALIVVLTVGIFLTGCAAKKAETPAPEPEATVAAPPAPTAPAAQTPPPKSAPPTASRSAPAPAKPTASAPALATKPAASGVAEPPAARPAAPVGAAPLDLIALKEELKASKAIGVFTKVSLKNKVDDLMAQFRMHYQGKTPPTMGELRQSYDLLIMKVLSLLQDSDKQLASKIVSSREAIWGLLSDPKKFAALDA